MLGGLLGVGSRLVATAHSFATALEWAKKAQSKGAELCGTVVKRGTHATQIG